MTTTAKVMRVTAKPKSYRVVFFRDTTKEWRWRFCAPNGRTIATCGEGYKRRAGAMNGWRSLQKGLRSGVVDVVIDA